MGLLHQKYNKEILSDLKKDLKLKNIFAVPRLKKIVVNIGLGEALTNKKVIEIVSQQLSAITGQKPVQTMARKAISTFKLQKGDIVGLKVTLRSEKMFDFLEKMISIVLPRIRDFRGIDEKNLDGKGNFTLGFAEQIAFPEIEYSKIDKLRGMEVTIVTTGKNREETKKLLEKLGMPFKK
ncbi:50S ribosomal protein L5 [Candidatus Gottesmanbacteria bacterium RIFCSPHIGHO2_01_FULL_39_10]|uniref:Large ribosomal subunit protein uL5 n=1 Tax=Candidatus Gottesmanbacteria bacterium RIFCSPHIGHO2_01_FULL_39_10 TaxID=1798375 RepID=A0A1F5ZSI1_9BACT|nr:MAG: 50S ribosomal protein L5 [Candidatus Gottesmanbacteria bacterium RIFCSPHIGHO2_01_FULL_39_10]